MNCGACGGENRDGARFCRSCGAPLVLACGACGAAHESGQAFCDECGAALTARPQAAAEPTGAPVAERRLVSVLFVDLVGFTTASESRDAEDTRELLSRYFEAARTVIERYGGTVEKFIGDAVMAVWGTPLANEDDAERAVRTALDLVAAVPELQPGLRARAGIMTGEAAVTLDARGEGMVAGDLVNTASRIQSAAEPGAVLAGESTKRATEAAIAYEDAGSHELKGKAETVRLYRALRVTAGLAGALKSVGLEPPFVGRDRELRLVKELFHASRDERTARLVSVVGVGGIGKSRLSWEFFKYLDGLADYAFWHRGRCLAYGEGVTYWALAEMVRMRAGIAEGEEPGVAREKLRAAVGENVPDPEDRDWVEPRLAHLLGLEERHVHEREDLFAGWRVFFERMAEQDPVVMVFEDMQWADASLLEFVEYLLDWSRSFPIFVVTLARPELGERHPQWGAGTRNFTSLSLEPLSGPAMEELLDGFVPGLPEELRERILARAEGVPLYAVETVRMLLDRGLLTQEGAVYRPTGPIEALAVPETLHALLAARLDGLEPDERRLLQDASVLGKTFTKGALHAVCNIGDGELEPLLTGLVRKEVLGLQFDPRSPERGQYGFLQDLLRRVAYETLARRDRKLRHLTAAAHLEQTFGATEQEVVEVVASHYVAAFEAAPEDDDAPQVKTKARETLARAGARAASLAASEEAERYFAQAAGLADDPIVEAELHERAGEMAFAAGQATQAATHFQDALTLFQDGGRTHPAARVSARLGETDWTAGKLEQAVERMEQALGVLSSDEPDADIAVLATQLGRLHFFSGNLDRALELIERGLVLAEALRLPEVLAQALNTYGVIQTWRGRPETAVALYTHSLQIALEHDLPTPALRAYNNLADNRARSDRYEEALARQADGIVLARRVGNRNWEGQLLLEGVFALVQLGRWDEALERAAVGLDASLETLPFPATAQLEVEIARGRIGEARRMFDSLALPLEDSADIQQRSIHDAARAVIAGGESRPDEQLEAAEAAIESMTVLSPANETVKSGFVEALTAALALDRLDKVEELLGRIDALKPGELPPFLAAQGARFHARLGAARGEQARVAESFQTAAARFRELGIVFWLAVTELEHGEWLAAQGGADEAEPLLAEAREIFERLAATPWLERLDRAATPVSV